MARSAVRAKEGVLGAGCWEGGPMGAHGTFWRDIPKLSEWMVECATSLKSDLGDQEPVAHNPSNSGLYMYGMHSETHYSKVIVSQFRSDF